MIVYTEACFYCKHLESQARKYPNKYRCKAFPDRIPNDIRTGQYDHCNPYPDDSGILFEPDYSLIKSVDRLDYIFAEIEKKRHERTEDPMYRSPLPYDWQKQNMD